MFLNYRVTVKPVVTPESFPELMVRLRAFPMMLDAAQGNCFAVGAFLAESAYSDVRRFRGAGLWLISAAEADEQVSWSPRHASYPAYDARLSPNPCQPLWIVARLRIAASALDWATLDELEGVHDCRLDGLTVLHALAN